MAFLPEGYETPQSGGKYLKLAQGDNKLRILASPILGYMAWTRDSAGKNHPVRGRMNEEKPGGDDPKHFWAMPVWSYEAHAIQILEITQQTIQNSIASLAKSEDWGSPLDYDITIHRTGSGLDTEYSVMPSPKAALHPKISEQFLELSKRLKMEALFDGDDPFGEQNNTLDPEKADEIPF